MSGTASRDEIALQFMLAMASNTALTPEAIVTRAYALTDAVQACALKAEILQPFGYQSPRPAVASVATPARDSEIPF